jgi:excinuclease UvrABC helicase subunit UvrB
MKFKINSDFKPMGDQINAIDVLTKNIKNNVKSQTLLRSYRKW